MDYVLIIIVVVMALGVLYFYYKFSPKKASMSLSLIDINEVDQDAINCEFVNKIIDGHHSSISKKDKLAVKTAFEKWQQEQKRLFRNATAEMKALREKYCSENKVHIFYFTYTPIDPRVDSVLPKNLTLFMENVFTEPFPSTHDMDDWAISTQLNDIFILQGITPEESKQFLVHEKNHFVNHKMTRAIIQLDIYKVTS